MGSKALKALKALAFAASSLCFLAQLSRQELSALTSHNAARATWSALRSGHSFESTLGRIDDGFAELLTSNAVGSMAQNDGCVKFLLKLSDGLSVESVLITPRGRQSATTICISSQVGCAQGCRFCRTGTMGLLRNLTAEEMIAQVVQGRRLARELSLPKVLKAPFKWTIGILF